MTVKLICHGSIEPGELFLVLPEHLELRGESQDHEFLELVFIEEWDNQGNTTIHIYPSMGGLYRRALYLLLGPSLVDRLIGVSERNTLKTRDIEVTDEEYSHIKNMIAIDTGHNVVLMAT